MSKRITCAPLWRKTQPLSVDGNAGINVALSDVNVDYSPLSFKIRMF